VEKGEKDSKKSTIYKLIVDAGKLLKLDLKIYDDLSGWRIGMMYEDKLE
jgi:hypothetical protein